MVILVKLIAIFKASPSYPTAKIPTNSFVKINPLNMHLQELMSHLTLLNNQVKYMKWMLEGSPFVS